MSAGGPSARKATRGRARAAGPRLSVSISDGRGRPLRVPGLAAWLQRVAPAAARGEVAIAIVGDARMRRVNRAYLDHDYATDVLSFPADADVREAHGSLGDLVIARGVAARQAREAGHSLASEFKVLALHGLLHLLGYDHEADDGTMRRVEARLRRKGGLRAGLIERSSR